jgi:regulator of replication initiation timing
MSDLELTMMRRVGELNKEVAALKAENARLKTEVEHLMVFCNCTLIPNKELQAEVERLTKAGDAMADEIVGCFNAEGYDPADSDALTNWYAAKEGKGQP